MAGQEEKKQRTISSRAFTRCYNRLNESILNKTQKDLIITKFDDLKRLWENVQSKHDTYLIARFPDEDEEFVNEQEDKWLEKYEERFELVQKATSDYLQSLDANKELTSKLKLKKEMSTQSKETLQSALSQRDSLHLIFKQEIKNVEENMKRDTNGVLKPQVMAGMKDVKSRLDKCKDAQLSYIYLNSSTHPEEENKWIEDVQADYETCNEQLFTYLKRVSEAENEEKQKIVTKMESIKMPTFNGNIREYAKFKADFKSQVENRLESPETLTYVLRSCLKEEALYLVENIEDASGIWQRLDDRFGKPSQLIDAIMDEIKSIGSLKEGDSKEFIKFVNIVEKGYADLLRLNLEREISNSVTVSMLEGRLPPIARREWSKEVNCVNSKVDPYNKFPSFMNFLKEQRKILEYETASLRMVKEGEAEKQGLVNYGVCDPLPYGSERAKVRCSIHKSSTHSMEDCRQYKDKPPQEQFEIVKGLRACWSCLNIGHRLNECPDKKECGVNKCTMFHHASLHPTLAVKKPYTPLSASTNPFAPAESSQVVSHTNSECHEIPSGKCILPIMKIQSGNQSLTVLWDSGATISMITFKKAKELKLQGKDCRLSVTKVGGQREQIELCVYTLPLQDKNNKVVNFKVYGIETITEGTEFVDISQVSQLFRRVNVEEVQRPQGEMEVLIGFNYAKFHPRRMQTSNYLLLMENRFGRCIAGCHPKLKETQHVVVNNAHVCAYKVESFLELEEMGIQCFPRCGNCGCKKCALGSKGLSIKEEKEQNLINNGLIYIEDEHRFISTYPWIKDPEELPDNYNVTKAIMENTERRLQKNPSHAKLYDDQFKDLLKRGAARILTKEEMENYNGPVYYLDHHAVLKEGSTTSCRLVFNSSRKSQGECINDYWGKGANQVNNLMGVLIRFRELKVVIVGDIKKMYHVITISLLDQHTHRFLW